MKYILKKAVSFMIPSVNDTMVIHKTYIWLKDGIE